MGEGGAKPENCRGCHCYGTLGNDSVGIQQNRIQGWMNFNLKEVSSSWDLCVSATMVSWGEGAEMNYHNSVWN